MDPWGRLVLSGDHLFVVSGDHLYWVSGEKGTGGLGVVGVDGSDPTPLFTDRSEGLGDGRVTYSTVAVDGTHVYWSRGESNRVAPDAGKQDLLRMPLSGGEPEPIARRQNFIGAIALTDEHVYWISSLAQRLLRVPKTLLNRDDE